MKNEQPVIQTEKTLFATLDALQPNQKSALININNTQRKTLKAIDEVRINPKFKNEGKEFRFGKLIKNGENKFVGIRVYRLK